MSIRNHAKVYELTKEMCTNNQRVSNLTAKIKETKDSVKAFSERNAEIMDELKVHVEDDLDTETT